MPAEVLELSNVDSSVLPSELFMDTSFLLDARDGERGQGYTSKAQVSWEFMDEFGGEPRLRIWTTPAVYQEAVFTLLAGVVQQETGSSYATLKRNDDAAFAQAHQKYAPAISQDLLGFLKQNNIELRAPKQRDDLRRTGVWIGEYAKWLLSLYPCDPADALHIACARIDGTRAMASNDLSWQTISGFTIYAFRSAGP